MRISNITKTILRNRKASLVLLLMFTFGLCASAQGLRVTYAHYYKKDKSVSGYYSAMDMTLDYIGGHSAFYSENSFLRDSLRAIAFDSRGKIVDEDAYGKILDLPATTSSAMTMVDYKTNEVRECYRIAVHVIQGTGVVPAPVWTVDDETTEILEYGARKAEADFMGRKWTVWFTEELPAGIGPWLLRGTPGLILRAEDSEGIFRFEARYIEELSEAGDRYGRVTRLKDMELKTGASHRVSFSGSLRECERINYKLNTDVDYFNRSSGIILAAGDDNSETLSYIPMISLSYWK